MLLTITLNWVAPERRLSKVRRITQAPTANSSNAGTWTQALDIPPGACLLPHSPLLSVKQGQQWPNPREHRWGDRARTATSAPGILSTCLSAPFSLYWKKSGKREAYLFSSCSKKQFHCSWLCNTHPCEIIEQFALAYAFFPVLTTAWQSSYSVTHLPQRRNRGSERMLNI